MALQLVFVKMWAAIPVSSILSIVRLAIALLPLEFSDS